jgi:hypothetical protein
MAVSGGELFVANGGASSVTEIPLQGLLGSGRSMRQLD